jgi:hypothetical protein
VNGRHRSEGSTKCREIAVQFTSAINWQTACENPGGDRAAGIEDQDQKTAAD